MVSKILIGRAERFIAVFCSVFIFVSACDSNQPIHDNPDISAESDDNNLPIPVPRNIINSRIELDDLELVLSINGQLVSTNRNSDDQWTTEVIVQPNTQINILIGWLTDGIELATLEDVFQVGDSNMTFSISQGDYTLVDSDGDSHTNIDEIDAGTDLDDPNSFPGNTDWTQLIFNENQTNCATQDLFVEAVDIISQRTGNDSVDAPLLEIQDDYNPLVLASGDVLPVEYDNSVNTLINGDVIEVTESGTLTVAHLTGIPTDSVGGLFQRNLSGVLELVGFNDDFDGAVDLRSVLSAPVDAGGYCYIYVAFGFILFGDDENFNSDSDLLATFSYELE